MMQLAMMMAVMQQAAAVQTQETTRATLPAGIAVAVLVGFTPEHLAAAGISAEQTATILQQLGASELVNEPLVKLMTTPPAIDKPISEVDTSLTKLLELRQEAMAIAGISSESDTGRKLTAVINSAGRGVPAELRVVERSEEEWRTLQLAVIAEKRAERLGRSVPTDAAATLSTARGDSDVAAAKSGFDTRKDAIEQVFKGR